MMGYVLEMRPKMSKTKSQRFWAWLKVKSNRTVLAWIGAGLLAVIAGAWKVYLSFKERAQKVSAEQTKGAAPDSSAAGKEEKILGAPIQQKAEASNGGNAINVGRDVNINK
jgi:hypothetical protein